MAVALDGPALAVMVTLVSAFTGVVVMGNVSVADPAGTITGDVTMVEGSLLVTAMLAPPGGAGAPSVIVPVDGAPPITVAGLTVTLVMFCA